MKARKSKTWSECRHYVRANDTMIMNHGEKDSKFFTDGFRKKEVVAQVEC